MGIVSFSDLYVGGSFGNFTDIATKFGISKLRLFRYFQLCKFTSHSLPSQPEKSLLEEIMSSPVSQKSISSIHSLLSSQLSPFLGLKDIWEKELDLTLDEI